MHWLADLMAAIGVVLNGIPQGIMARTLGFAIFPTSFSFAFGALVNGAVGSVAPISFQAESLGLLSRVCQTHRERSSIIFGGSIFMLVIGLTGTLTSIVHVLGNGIIAGMMAGVGLMLSKISLTMVKNERIAGGTSVGVAVLTYLDNCFIRHCIKHSGRLWHSLSGGTATIRCRAALSLLETNG